MRHCLSLAGLLALCACNPAPTTRGKPDQGTRLLRVVYRDADSEMVLMVPEKG